MRDYWTEALMMVFKSATTALEVSAVVRFPSKYVLLVIGLSLVFMLTGCFQSMSTDNEPTPISQLFASDTPLPPSQTPQPTFTPFPTGEVQQQTVIVTATPEPTNTVDPLATSVDALSADLEQQQVPPTATISAGLQEATRIIQEATQRALDQTATAEGPVVVPTFTPEQFGPSGIPTATPLGTGGTTTTTTGTCVHTVAVGDNLFQISLRYDVPITTIANSNGITNPQVIVVGDELTIPGCNSSTGFTQSGTTGTTTQANVTCPGRNIQHTVAQYETMFQLSQQYDVPIADIARCNNITNYNIIVFSDVLIIP